MVSTKTANSLPIIRQPPAMKVLPFRSEVPIMEKPNLTARFLMLMIKVFFIPVRIDNDGYATYSICSFRTILSFSLWCLPPICGVAAVLIRDIIPQIYMHGLSDVAILTQAAVTLNFIIMAACFTFCYGYLFGQVKLKIPQDVASTNQLKLVMVATLGIVNTFLPELLGAEIQLSIFCFKISCVLIYIELSLGLCFVHIVASSFKRKVQLLQSSGGLSDAAEEALALYQSINNGLGPLLLVFFSSITMVMTIALYLLTKGISNPFEQIMGILWDFLILYELSAYGQDLRDDLREAIALIRY